jgi:hypothetical protein
VIQLIPRATRTVLPLLLVMPAILSCVTFSDLPSPAPRVRDADAHGNALSVFIRRDNDPNQKDGLWMLYPAEPQVAMALETLRESIRKTPIIESPDPEGADLTLRVEKWRHLHSAGMFTLLTAGLIPGRWNQRIIIKMTRKQPGAIAKSCVQIHRYQQWVQLFLLPFMSSNSLRSHEDAAVSRMTARCAFEVLSSERKRPESSPNDP